MKETGLVNNIPQYEPWFHGTEGDILKDYMDHSNGWVTEFSKTKEFEKQIAEFLGVKHCIVVNNGTISLSIALHVLGVRPDNAVIVPDLTMVASANAVSLIGAYPVLVDISPRSLCLDVDKTIEECKKGGITAVIYVSLNGRCDEDLIRLRDYCSAHNIALIEDAAQSFGSKYRDRFLGTIGDIGSFSFSPQKTITTGQGGALVTNNDDWAARIRCFKDFGREEGGVDIHTSFGINSKFTDLQALIGLEQIKHIEERVWKKQYIYDSYYKRLVFQPGVLMHAYREEGEVPWFVDIYTEKRAALHQYLQGKGIGTRKVYPPIHTQPYCSIKKDFLVASYISDRGLWLPSSINLDICTIDKICSEIRLFFQEG